MPLRRVSHLAHILGIGINRMAHIADALTEPEILRLEALDKDFIKQLLAFGCITCIFLCYHISFWVK